MRTLKQYCEDIDREDEIKREGGYWRPKPFMEAMKKEYYGITDTETAQDIARNVIIGMRTKAELKRCGCEKCKAALEILK